MTVIISGSAGIQNVLGSAASPAESNTTSSNTGMYFPTSTSVGISTNGTLAMTVDANQNVGVGTSSPAATAIIDAQSTTKGVRFPNMTTAQKTAITPSAGTVVFDTTLTKLCVYSGSAWQTITSV
jgi:hypothetical protein